jgi:ribosomal protein S8
VILARQLKYKNYIKMMNTVFTKDFFINIVNANVKKKQDVFIRYSLKHELLLKSLKLNGFIRGFEINKNERKILVFLKYDHFLNSSINSLKITSKVNL